MLCLGKIHQNPDSNEAWKKRIKWITSSQSYRDFDGISGEPTEFEWNIFPGFDTLQLCGKVKDLLSRLGETPETIHRKNSIYVDVQQHFLGIWDHIADKMLLEFAESESPKVNSEAVNTIHPEPEIHEQIYIYMTKRLRNIVHDYNHILTFIERIVSNCVNDATHADELTMQH